MALPVWAEDIESGRPKAQAAAVRLSEVLTPWEKSHLGLSAGSARNISLGQPLVAFTINRPDLSQAENRSWGGLFKETDLVFWPVRVAAHPRAGVWLRRTDKGWQAVGVGDKKMARALARAKLKINAALISRGLYDPYHLRLLVLDWAACRMLAVMVRDRILVWPLPSAVKLLKLKPDFYPMKEIRPMLTGRSPG
ncbi:MAG: hypothetical protein JRJ59_05680 [Deltaproteobacteria bacterium]|nr:hypothetical protein [Deltaproteobacteria bacterium]